jgi:hypothetical protein
MDVHSVVHSASATHRSARSDRQEDSPMKQSLREREPAGGGGPFKTAALGHSANPPREARQSTSGGGR